MSGTDVTEFNCCASFDENNPGNCLPKNPAYDESSFDPYPRACNCLRGNVSVGVIDHAEMSRWGGFIDPWVQRLGGSWFSTPREGKCNAGKRPGHGAQGECTWRMVAGTYKNTSCVDAQLDAAVETHGKTCFATCPSQASPAYADCYLSCYFDSVGGNVTAPGGALAAMTKSQLVTPWTRAIQEEDPTKGGCPRCHGEPPYHLGSCPWRKAATQNKWRAYN
jgi:hypothetical protein